MTPRKITTVNTVKYIPQKEQTRERDSKPNTIKKNSLLKKIKNFHKIMENSLKIIEQEKDLE